MLWLTLTRAAALASLRARLVRWWRTIEGDYHAERDFAGV
jgi:hypothetical protein